MLLIPILSCFLISPVANKQCIFQQAGKGDFETLEKLAMKWGGPKVPSAKQVFG
jgi:hypothetical protein